MLDRMNQNNNNKTLKQKKRKRSKGKKKEEVVIQDLTSENAKNEMISALLQKTDLNEESLIKEYDKFYEMYPGGEINEQQFLQISKVKIKHKALKASRKFNATCLCKHLLYENIQFAL